MSTVIPAPAPEQIHDAAQYCARTYDGGIDQPTRSRVRSGIKSLLALHDILGDEYFALCHLVSLLAILEHTHQNKTAGKAEPASAPKPSNDALTARLYFAGIAFQMLHSDPMRAETIETLAAHRRIPSLHMYISSAFDIADTILARAPAPKG